MMQYGCLDRLNVVSDDTNDKSSCNIDINLMVWKICGCKATTEQGKMKQFQVLK